MTCFWDGILLSLNNDDFLILNFNKKPTIYDLVQKLKQYNTLTLNILWQSSVLSHRQNAENFQHVRDFDINSIYQGYLCSSCDPFLCLICELLHVNIIHVYNGTSIYYIFNQINEGKNLRFESNIGHFWLSTK
jgi:hypothetical protein